METGIESNKDAQEYLLGLFARKHVKKISGWRREAGRDSSLVCISIAASNDRCVLPIDSQELHDLLAKASRHEEINWFAGGHLLGIRSASARFAPVIERAIDILHQGKDSSSCRKIPS
jgi:hypothetical protein